MTPNYKTAIVMPNVMHVQMPKYGQCTAGNFQSCFPMLCKILQFLVVTETLESIDVIAGNQLQL